MSGLGSFFFPFYTLLQCLNFLPQTCIIFTNLLKREKETENSTKQKPRVIKRTLAYVFRDLGSLPEIRHWGHWLSHFMTLGPKSCTSAAFLNLNTNDILGQSILCCRGHPVHYRMFSSTPGLYLLETHLTPPQLVTPKMTPDTAKCAQRSKTAPS